MGERAKRESKKENKRDNKKKKKRIGLRIFLVFLLILIIAGGVFAYRVYQNGWGWQGLLATTLGHDINTLKDLEPITFVLIGESDHMSDTILLCSYNPKNGKASMLSIARDTYVGSNPDRATASQKINSLFQLSPEKLVEAVAKVTEIDVTNYVVVDTAALVKIVDAIGGVWYDVPIDMDYDDEGQKLDIDLKAGYQKLDGVQAEGLVRFRHNNDGSTYSYEYGMEDYGRNRTQREFIIEVVKQTIQFHNIFKIGEFYDIIKDNVKTNMDMNLLKDYIPYAVNINTEDIISDRLPGEDKLVNNNSVWIFIHDKKETKAMVQEMFIDIQNEEDDEIAKLKVEILNASGNSDKLQEVTEKLNDKGYRVLRSTEINATQKTIVINRSGVSVEAENALLEDLGAGVIQLGEEIEDLEEETEVDFTIVIGKDYK